LIVRFDWKTLTILKNGKAGLSIPAHCNVRNEVNEQRKDNQIVLTTPVRGDKKPYMPRQIPSGIWRITDIVYTDVSDYAPVIIKTDAMRPVFTWELDKDGNYLNSTEEIQIDGSYWIHYNNNSHTSWGCILPDRPADVLELARIIETEKVIGNAVFLEVI